VNNHKDKISKQTELSRKDSLKETKMENLKSLKGKMEKSQEKLRRERKGSTIETWIASSETTG
jgi:hypothetical protein